MRKKLYDITENALYDTFMLVMIIVSMIPLVTKANAASWLFLDLVVAIIFIVDYIIKFVTADFRLNLGAKSFLKYPFTHMAIIDFLAILPSISIFMMIHRGVRLLRLFKLFRTFRIFRVFKVFRYSKNIKMIINVFKRERDSLSIVFALAVGYIFVSALLIFNVEPDTFPSFFDALYWATVSLTTIGYGDYHAVSYIGKFITMVSALFGVAIVALPAGIITAGYMEELSKLNDESLEKKD